jgi:glycosyltransferase involved in cell wall biosynthesis
MRVAWICYYPPHLIPDRPRLRNDLAHHPVPWVSLQAPLVAQRPNIDLHVIRVGKAYTDDDHFTHENISFHFLRQPRLPRVLSWYQVDRLRIQDCLRRINPDLVHGFGTESSYSYAAVTSPYPSVVMMQGVNAEIYRSLGRLRWRRPHLIVPLTIERFTVRKCRNFICETEFSARFVRRHNHAAKVHLLRTPVRHEFFLVEREAREDGPPILLFAGSLIPEKGIEILLRAFAKVRDELPSAQLRIAGYATSAYEQTLRSLTADLRITDQVTFCGYLEVDSLIKEFAAATALVLPSFMDTAPNAVAEAQVAGLPVVATRVGGIPEMIEDNVTGLLVEPYSVESLICGILRLLSDCRLRVAIADAAQQRARRDCAPELQVSKLVDIYQTIVD